MKKPGTRPGLFDCRLEVAATFNPGDPDWKASGLIKNIRDQGRICVHEMENEKACRGGGVRNCRSRSPGPPTARLPVGD